MYNDVALDPKNPYPGKLFNRPSSLGGKDVFKGCKMSYTGADVNPEVFLNVIQGNSGAVRGIGSGEALNSTENDDVFINFVDHGAPGLVAFPSKEMHREELEAALQVMHKRKMYKKLVFYLEACESGSMFDNLADGLNIYAVTAANARESSFGTFCPPNDDIVDGIHMNTCLGDEFSVNWMYDTGLEVVGQKESLTEQYARVRNATKKSHVMRFGDLNIASLDIDNFLGREHPSEPLGKDLEGAIETSKVDSRDITFVSKFYRMLNLGTPQAQAEFRQELAHREQTDAFFTELVSGLFGQSQHLRRGLPDDKHSAVVWACHRAAHAAFKRLCGGWSDYSLKYSAMLLDICDSGIQASDLVESIQWSCNKADTINVDTSLSSQDSETAVEM